jgi:hypothetical protein
VCDNFIPSTENVFWHFMNGLELHDLFGLFFFFLLRLSHKMAFPFSFLTVLFKGGAAVTHRRPHVCTAPYNNGYCKVVQLNGVDPGIIIRHCTH